MKYADAKMDENDPMGVAMEMTEGFSMGVAAFAGMLFLVWILPSLACRKGKFPEDFPHRKA